MEISFWGYVIIFLVGVLMKVLWAFGVIIFLQWMKLLNMFLEEIGHGAIWKMADESRFKIISKFLILFVFGLICQALLRDILGFNGNINESFPLINVLRNGI